MTSSPGERLGCPLLRPCMYHPPVPTSCRSSDDFNAAQLKAVCVEAGMLALRR